MRQFFKFLFASCLGVILASLVLMGIGSLIITSIAKQTTKGKDLKPNTVLHLTFENPVPEQTNNLELDPFDINQDNILGLKATTDALERAAADENIKGIFLEVDGLAGIGMANIEVLRDALLEFKSTGKFIYAYSKYYSQGAYYLATAADEVYLNPLGMVDFKGFAAQIPFFKDMLDKIGMDMQIFYAGKFKGATEPYRFNEMSEPNRLQIRTYLDDIYQNYLAAVSESRGLSTQDLHAMANDYTGLDPVASADKGMIDHIAHRDEVISAIKEQLGLDEDEKIPFRTLEDFNESNPVERDYKIKDKIAIIYAEGTIIDGKSDPGSVGDETYADYIRKARKDDKVKAIVLRVNSPGGSAMSSEHIWRELSLAKEAGKPVVVSMGDYAASGGYYISAMADSIFAEPNTLTGSIGVFMVIPNASELLDDKLGIHFDSVKTANSAQGITPFYPLSEQEKVLLQKRTDDLYDIFLQRVADGRGLSKDAVHAIAQGRVWTGERALEIGLVDRIGGLEQAVASAAELASLDTYRTTAYPKVKEPLQMLMEQWLGEDSFRAGVASKFKLKNYYEHLKLLEELQAGQNAQARLPFLIPFE